MKEIIAIIRPGKDRETKEALRSIDCFACTSHRVYGRGKQRGLKYQVASKGATELSQAVVMRYLPKKMITIVVPDGKVKPVVETIIRVNQSGQFGDGRIFVMDAKEAYRIRTGEKGEDVLQ